MENRDNISQIKLKCFICNKTTDHKVKQLKSGHEYICPVCKSSKYIPNDIKKEYRND
jgi:Zn finger protein HypA/HybF involved in hydrogenase expression